MPRALQPDALPRVEIRQLPAAAALAAFGIVYSDIKQAAAADGTLSPETLMRSGFAQRALADQRFMCGAECIEPGRNPAIGCRMQQRSFDLLDSNAVV